MHLLSLLTVGCLFATTLAQDLTTTNTSREYQLCTCLKPGQPDKLRYDNLYLYAYHTGAGMNDVVGDPQRTNISAAGYLAPTNVTSADGSPYYDQAFDLGNPFPWQMVMAANVNFYASWEPVRINAGLGGESTQGTVGGFFMNATGLQWTSAPTSGEEANEFGGWLVCDWWHEAPQLFFRNRFYNSQGLFTPSSCADVYLIPAYI